MKIHNIRYGFATNSSSSHSVILSPGLTDQDVPDGLGFGWENFILASTEQKRRYLFTAAFLHYSKDLSNEEAATLAAAAFEVDERDIECATGDGDSYNSDCYIDHQSTPRFPRPKKREVGMWPLWALLDQEIARSNKVAISGGNDNQDNEEWKPLRAQCAPEVAVWSDLTSSPNGSWTVDPATGHFTFFNPLTGKKVRILPEGIAAPAVASVPELVDIKITDYCPVGCSYCVDPDTKVLRSNLTWVPIDALEEGEKILAFDGFPVDDLKQRRFREALVEKKWSVEKDAVRVVTDQGEVICSADHKFLITHNGGRWMRADRLRLGHTIAFGEAPWTTPPASRNYIVGYLYGMSRGDGTARWQSLEGATSDPNDPRRQVWWRVALADREPLDRIVGYLDQLEIPHHGVKPFDGGSDDPAHKSMEKVELRAKASLSRLKDIFDSADSADRDFRLGYLAGALDSEGSYSGGCLRFSQVKPSDFLDRVQDYLADIDVESVREDRAVRVLGGMWSIVRLLGLIGSAMTRRRVDWLETSPRHASAQVVRLESLGKRRLIDIQTTTRTFYAAGMASHNCYQGSTKQGKHADLKEIQSFARYIGRMGTFEVAIGGGDPTTHPDFIEILKAFYDNGVIPNFSTQMWDWLKKDDIVEAVAKYCGAVALSTQSPKQAEKFIEICEEKGIKPHIHYVLGLSPLSNLADMLAVRASYRQHLVILAYKEMGRAQGTPPIDYTGWQNVVRDADTSRWNIAVDSFLVSDVDAGFTRDEVPSHLYESADGKFSLYWDAVVGAYAAHSFKPQDERIVYGKDSASKIAEAWRQISGSTQTVSIF